MFKKEYLKFICCPDCRNDLVIQDRKLFCQECEKNYSIIANIPILLPGFLTSDDKISQKKWDEKYEKTLDESKLNKFRKHFRDTYEDSIMSYINKIFSSVRNKKYLEIGCGPFFIGQRLAKSGAFVVGIDYSLSGLQVAKYYLKKEKIENYLLICGDITKMPFKANVFDLLYGGGVIEHFKDTVEVVRENYRVIKRRGIAFNTVPYLNLGALTYRQVWGNIPNAPVLKEIAEFVHIKLLRGKYMAYGYEYSFTKSHLLKIFMKAGFKRKDIEIDKFQVPLIFEYIKVKFLRDVATYLTTSTDLFWPAIYIKSRK